MRSDVAYDIGDIRAYISRKLATAYDEYALHAYVSNMINKHLPFREYEALPGHFLEDKARLLIEDVHKNSIFGQ